VRGGGTPPGRSKARARPIDRDGRWTIKRGRKQTPPSDETQRQTVGEIALPVSGNKNHIWGCGPDEGPGFTVVLVDEAVDGSLEVDDGAEDPALKTAGKQSALSHGQPCRLVNFVHQQ
jgi:hypothetical protein